MPIHDIQLFVYTCVYQLFVFIYFFLTHFNCFHLINSVGFFWTTQGINIKKLKKIDPLVINFSVQVNLTLNYQFIQ
jgi:hypothetical protein